MAKWIELTGKRIGRFIVVKLEQAGVDKKWLCLCDCKTYFIRRQKDLTKGLVYECPNCVFRRSQYYIGGKKFGRLNVLHEYKFIDYSDVSRPSGIKKIRHWKCKCECGNEKWISAESIIRGLTTSCGCFMQKNNSRYANETLYPQRPDVPVTRHPIYRIWICLLQKCYNPKYIQYKNWGAQGFTICQLWKNSAETFVEWMISHNWEQKFTIVCKDGEKEFSPKNCFIQPFNEYLKDQKKLSCLRIYGYEYKGIRKTIPQWAKHFDLTYGCLLSRMQKYNFDLAYCLDSNNFKNTGNNLRRDDVSDDEILRLHDAGKSIKEIRGILHFCPRHRLKRLGRI